jgi:type II secretory pathway pseudopilin PulG
MLIKIKNNSAFTFVDIIVGSIVIAIIIGSLVLAFQNAVAMLSVSRHRLEAVMLCHRQLELLKLQSFSRSPDLAIDTFTPTLPPGAMINATGASIQYQVFAGWRGNLGHFFATGCTLRDNNNTVREQYYAKRIVATVSWTENLTGRNFSESVSLLIIPEQSEMICFSRP